MKHQSHFASSSLPTQSPTRDVISPHRRDQSSASKLTEKHRRHCDHVLYASVAHGETNDGVFNDVSELSKRYEAAVVLAPAMCMQISAGMRISAWHPSHQLLQREKKATSSWEATAAATTTTNFHHELSSVVLHESASARCQYVTRGHSFGGTSSLFHGKTFYPALHNFFFNLSLLAC